MEKTLISWNVPNLITVWLMLAIGFVLLGLVSSYAGGMFAKKAPASGAGGY